jgi:hypothetical protein
MSEAAHEYLQQLLATDASSDLDVAEDVDEFDKLATNENFPDLLPDFNMFFLIYIRALNVQFQT